MSTNTKSGDRVGYGNPPKHSRFKSGQSGNPNGRPSGSKTTATLLREILLEKVTVSQGSRKKRMSRLEVMIRAAVRKAVQGDSRACRNVMHWADDCGLVIAEDKPKQQQLNGVFTYSKYAEYLRELDE